jgi:hypothetical protein
MKRVASAALVGKREKRTADVAAAVAAKLTRISGMSEVVSASTDLPTGIARLIASLEPGTCVPKFGPLSLEIHGVVDGGEDMFRIRVVSDTTLIQLNRALQRLHGDTHSILLYCQGTTRQSDADIGPNRFKELEYATVEQVYRPLLNPEGILRLRTWFRR